MLRAVIFDFDGVVADSEFLHYQALNEVFKRHGVDIPKEVHWAKYLGYTDQENVDAVNADYGMGLDAAGVAEMIRAKTEVFDRLAETDAAIIDGVVDFVEMLKENGVPRAVCSGATLSDIRIMLEGTELVGAFDPIVTADDVSKGKPDPEGYLLALARLNEKLGADITVEQCVVIEDSHWGLEAAAAAGMHVVGVTNTYPAGQLDGKADMIVDRLDVIGMGDLEGLCG